TKNDQPIKLDFLWVIDNSSSMCQEQASLARSFDAFVGQLESYLNVDINLAVTTSDAIKGQGKFSNTPATKFPNACNETELLPCATNSECTKAFGQSWACKPPPSSGQGLLLYNKNGSLNSSCFYTCSNDGDCCESFCYGDECGGEAGCVEDLCGDPEAGCTQTCLAPGGGTDTAKTCVAQPDTADCPGSGIPSVLTDKNLDLFPCIATVGADQSFTANLESGLKTAWMALDPRGLQAEQSAGFLRDDAYLVIVFVSDEEDCSIDEDFAAPSYECEKDADCPGYTRCEDGLCYGVIKKDYYNICGLLGEYKGRAHHNCAYDLGCEDCESDADCDEGWYCKGGKKCRPYIYGFNTISSFQNPAGTPIFALAPVSKYYSQLRSLKSDPAKVLVAAIVGDVLVEKSDEKSLISDECIEDAKLAVCQEYVALKGETTNQCKEDPHMAGCEAFLAAKQACARECYIASKGDPTNPQAKNTYVCTSPFGTADWGSRYVRLAEMFGPNGVVSNICSEEGISPALESVAELIIKRVTKLCLPRFVKEGERITVTRSYEDENGDWITEKLVEGDDGDYRIEYPTQDCCFADEKTGTCTGTLRAVTFNDVLDPSWE
ncbi:MAG: hypothetical protein FJ098_15505, partial [Deltaproteobacteria bacterium]|nr:hypothetical protein [Deltaproteobacteria bacterium]